MARRPSQTAVDYVVVGIAPALIIALVGSLAFFIIDVGYTGSFSTRLTAVTGFFVMGAVLVTRIAIEIDKERAQLYGLALAVVTFVAIVRFVDASLLLDFVLIAVTWWCAHRLTYDCTVIEDDKTASGEGLLQTMGLDDAGDSSQEQRDTTIDVTATTDDVAGSDDDFATIWQRFVNRRKKHHAPGITVVYFSAAALPIFGIGQIALIAQGRNESSSAFRYMLLYVASALALLMATSFLQLRRYLRQRRLQMPIEMTGVWLGSGAIIVVLVMLFCLMMPRPTPGDSLLATITSVASRTGLTPNQWGMGQDGPDTENSGKQITERDSTKTRDGDGDADGDLESQDSKGDESPNEGDNDLGDDPSGESSGETGNEASDVSNVSDAEQESSQSQSQEDSQRDDGNESESDRKDPDDSSRGANDDGEHRDKAEQHGSQGREQSSQHQPDSPGSPKPIAGLQSLGDVIRQISRLAYYLLTTVVIAYAMIRYRSVVAESLRQFWKDLRRLFGKKKTVRHKDAQIEVSTPGLPPRVFRISKIRFSPAWCVASPFPNWFVTLLMRWKHGQSTENVVAKMGRLRPSSPTIWPAPFQMRKSK